MLRIFLKLKEQYIKTEMEYTFNFFMMLISGILTRTLIMAIPFVIYNNIPSIAGWKEHELYLIMSFLFIAEGLNSILFEGTWQIPGMVFSGQFDSILTRPVSPLYQVLSCGMGLQGIGVFLFGIISLNLSLNALGKYNLVSALLCLFLIICGTFILMSVYLLSNSLIFWYDTGGRTNLPFTINSIGQYARYPINIYPIGVQLILLFLIPYGFIGMIPAYIIRGEHMVSYSLLLIGMSLLFFFIARFVFYRGIRKYESMGM